MNLTKKDIAHLAIDQLLRADKDPGYDFSQEYVYGILDMCQRLYERMEEKE